MNFYGSGGKFTFSINGFSGAIRNAAITIDALFWIGYQEIGTF